MSRPSTYKFNKKIIGLLSIGILYSGCVTYGITENIQSTENNQVINQVIEQVQVTKNTKVSVSTANQVTEDFPTPHASTPQASTPNTSTPNTSTPNTSTPNTSTPNTSTPNTSTPHTPTLNTSMPHIRTPNISTSHIPTTSSGDHEKVSTENQETTRNQVIKQDQQHNKHNKYNKQHNIKTSLVKKNMIVICLEGLSRNTLYKLLNKKKLPNIQSIIKRGNYRNLELSGHPSEPIDAYQELLTGHYQWLQVSENKTQSIPKGLTLFDHIKTAFPDMKVGAILSALQSNKTDVTLEKLLENTLPSLNYKSEIIPRTSKGVAEEVKAGLSQMQTEPKDSFFLFINFTDIDVMGHHYREGGERYSDAVKECDRAIGRIIARLKEINKWETTEFILTTNYGFKEKSRDHDNQIKSWIASSFKIRYKGTLGDVVPTILRFFRIDQTKTSPKLPGKKLIY